MASAPNHLPTKSGAAPRAPSCARWSAILKATRASTSRWPACGSINCRQTTSAPCRLALSESLQPLFRFFKLSSREDAADRRGRQKQDGRELEESEAGARRKLDGRCRHALRGTRSEEHTSELQSPMYLV